MAVITKGVTIIGQVNTVLGCSSGDWGALCTWPAINKWAKCKPIRYPKTGELTATERRGKPADITAGIIYGVKIGSVGATQEYATLHDITFDYVGKPTGGITSEPFRILDFVGYDHEARPSLNGSFGQRGYYDVSKQFVVNCVYDSRYAQTGIDFSEVIAAIGSDLKNCLPCMIVSNKARTTHYICALWSEVNGNYAVRQMWYGGHWLNTFYADFSTGTNFPSAFRNIDLYATLFIIPDLGVGRTFPADGNWHLMGESFTASERGYAVPEAIKVELRITAGDTTPKAVWDNTYISTASGLQLGYTFNTTPTSDVLMRCVTDNGIVKEFVYRHSGISIKPIFTWDELQLGYMPGASFSINVHFDTRLSASDSWRIGANNTVTGTM